MGPEARGHRGQDGLPDRKAARREQFGPIVPDVVDRPLDRPDAQPVGGEGTQQCRHVTVRFASQATNRPPRGVRLHFAVGATRIRPSVVRAGVNCRETPAKCRHHRNSARQPFPRMRPRTANGAGRRTTTGTATRLSRPMRSPAHRKRRSRCCASGRRWRNSGPMTRSPGPSGPRGSLWSFRRSSQKPKTGRAMPSAMHGQHGTIRGRHWTPQRRGDFGARGTRRSVSYETLRAAEVALVLGRGAPACLAGGLAGRSTGGLRAVTLVMALRGSGRNNVRQHLHLRRLPPAMASPPARTHHRHGDRRSGPDAGSSRPPSFAISERSIDRSGPSCDRNFKPLDLGENQSDADTQCVAARPMKPS